MSANPAPRSMNLNAPPLYVIWWGRSVWPTVLFCWAAGYLGTSSVQDQEDEADEGRAGEDSCLEPTGPSFASDGLHDNFEVSTDALLSFQADWDRFSVRAMQ